MNLPLQYQIAQFQAEQIYLHLQNKQIIPQSLGKRYFKAIPQQQPDQQFLLMAYNEKLFCEEALQQHLIKLEQLENDERCPFPRIIDIILHAQLTYVGNPQHQIPMERDKFIVVVMKKNDQQNFISFTDFAKPKTYLTEHSIKSLTLKLVQIILFMEARGFQNMFHPESVFIGENTGIIQIFGFGDQQFFLVKKDRQKDYQKIGYFVFTCLMHRPPYESGSPYYKLLKRKEFNKFWKLIDKQGSLPSECRQFINYIFSTEKLSNEVLTHPWLNKPLAS